MVSDALTDIAVGKVSAQRKVDAQATDRQSSLHVCVCAMRWRVGKCEAVRRQVDVGLGGVGICV